MNRPDGQRWVLQGRWAVVTAGVVLLIVLALVFVGHRGGSAKPQSPTREAVPWEPYVPSPAVSILPAEPSTSSEATKKPSDGPAAKLLLTVDSVPSTVELTDEGDRDWLHWGLTGADGLDRKSGGTGEIEDTGGTGKRGRYDNNPELFGWQDGTPNSTVSDTPTGVYACGTGSSFTLRVAAGPSARTLRFYAGVWMAEGELTVSMAGKTADATLENPDAIRTARFTIRFRAEPPTTLKLTWTATRTYHPTCGNIDMQAATLS